MFGCVKFYHILLAIHCSAGSLCPAFFQSTNNAGHQINGMNAIKAFPGDTALQQETVVPKPKTLHTLQYLDLHFVLEIFHNIYIKI